MADQDNPKPKLKRSTLLWILPVIFVPTVLYMFVSKGSDLGQKQANEQVQAKADKEKAERMSARVVNPAGDSAKDAEEALTKAKRSVDGVTNNQTTLPPRPSLDTNADAMVLTRMAEARAMIGSTLPPDEKQSTGLTSSNKTSDAGSFVVYSAPMKDGMIPRAADSVKEAATLSDKEPKPAPKPFLSSNNDKVVNATGVVTATRIDGTHWIAAGTVVRAVLLNAVDTRIPGQVTARTTEPIYDSRYGRNEVIPAGSTLIGQYDSKITNGQVRVLMAFDSLITPSGGVVALNGIRASDALGRIGVEGELHTHFWQRMGIATMLALEAVGMEKLSNRSTVVNSSTGTSTTTDMSAGAQIIADAAKAEIAARTSLGPNITMEEGRKISVITTGNIEIPPVATKR